MPKLVEQHHIDSANSLLRTINVSELQVWLAMQLRAHAAFIEHDGMQTKSMSPVERFAEDHKRAIEIIETVVNYAK